MGSNSTFQQILEEKLRFSEGKAADSASAQGHSQSENTRFSEGNSSSTEEKSTFETLIASFLNRNVNFKFTSTVGQSAKSSPQAKSAYPHSPRKKSRPAEKTVLAQDITPAAVAALNVLVQLGASELKSLDLLSETIVKRAFRRLALRLHPDQNPHLDARTCERDFRRAREAYNKLMSEVAAKAAA